MTRILEKYSFTSDGIPVDITISEKDEEFINSYDLEQAKIGEATEAVLGHLRERIIQSLQIKISEMVDVKALESVKKKFIEKANELVAKEIGEIDEQKRSILVGKLTHELLGMGDMELLLSDPSLEELVINSSREPVMVYHRKYNWLKTNIYIKDEAQILNYASIIARRVGRQVSNLAPLLDAHLSVGDRANATLFPISTKGNCITIRKFARDPWTVIRMIESKTINVDIAALLWLCIQYELNIIVSGGTASGKTSILNALLVFTPPNQRVISIEDTRELLLPDFLQWTPLTTRLPNPEGKGEVTMLDLMVNSLRMRPDRIVVGEIRRKREAEVLFEAMHTGHAVYSTLHADNSDQLKSRMTTPPIDLPESMLGALHLMLIQYRQRRTGIRRTFEVAEVVPMGLHTSINKIYRWNPKLDTTEKIGEYMRLTNELMAYSGMTIPEIQADLDEKKCVLEYLVRNKVFGVNEVGSVVALYYRNKAKLMETIEAENKKQKRSPSSAVQTASSSSSTGSTSNGASSAGKGKPKGR
ncbi:MAG: ATPase, T2SS/T4P/T4SS family [Candidatus Micrarchaeota archaeon]